MKKRTFLAAFAAAILAVSCVGPQKYTINGSISKHPLASYVDSVYLTTPSVIILFSRSRYCFIVL